MHVAVTEHRCGPVLARSAVRHQHWFLHSHWDTCYVQVRRRRLGEDRDVLRDTAESGHPGGFLEGNWGLRKHSDGKWQGYGETGRREAVNCLLFTFSYETVWIVVLICLFGVYF